MITKRTKKINSNNDFEEIIGWIIANMIENSELIEKIEPASDNSTTQPAANKVAGTTELNKEVN